MAAAVETPIWTRSTANGATTTRAAASNNWCSARRTLRNRSCSCRWPEGRAAIRYSGNRSNGKPRTAANDELPAHFPTITRRSRPTRTWTRRTNRKWRKGVTTRRSNWINTTCETTTASCLISCFHFRFFFFLFLRYFIAGHYYRYPVRPSVALTTLTRRNTFYYANRFFFC